MNDDLIENGCEPIDFAPALKPTGPQIKRRVTWVDLPSEYEGFKAQIWLNCPTKYWTALSGDSDEALEAVQKIVIAHNGWLDFDGDPYPPAGDPAFWDEIPTELAACVLAVAQAEIKKLPNSIGRGRRRSKRG